MFKYLLSRPRKSDNFKKQRLKRFTDIRKHSFGNQSRDVALRSKNWAPSCTNNALRQVVTGSMNNSCNCESLNNVCVCVCVRAHTQYKKLRHPAVPSTLQRHSEANLPPAAVFSNTKESMVLSDDVVRLQMAYLQRQVSLTMSWSIHVPPK